MTNKICPHCGTSVVEALKECPGCGTLIDTQTGALTVAVKKRFILFFIGVVIFCIVMIIYLPRLIA